MRMVETGIVLMILAGLFLLDYPFFWRMGVRLARKIGIRRHLRHPEEDEVRTYGRLLSPVQDLLRAADSPLFRDRPDRFVLCSGLIGAGVFSVLVRAEGVRFAGGAALFSVFLPYLLLRVRLSEARVGSSKEGNRMVRELLNQYKIHDQNMKEAIEAAAAGLEGAPRSRHLLYELAKGMNRVYTREDIQECLDRFRYAVGTAWGGALASLIYFSHVRGIRVEEALEDLSDSLSKSRQVVEVSRRENNEPDLMLRYLAPACYLLSVVTALTVFGFSPAKFLRYQFGTALGLKWFVIAAGTYVAGVLLERFLAREKMDL